MRYIIIAAFMMIFSACSLTPYNIPMGVYTMDSNTNAIEGLKCTFIQITNNSSIGITYTDTNGEATMIVKYGSDLENISDVNEIRTQYRVIIEDEDGTNNYGEYYATNIIVPEYNGSDSDLWIFMIKK